MDRDAAVAWQLESYARCTCGHPRDEAWVFHDDPPEVVEAKYARYGSRAVKCVACAAADAGRREYEQMALTGPQGEKVLDRDGIHFPVTEA